MSYKGDGGAITVNYGTDGNTTIDGTFYITGATGASTKAGAHNLCIYDGDVGTNDWVLAELIPSSSINNIDSFRLKFDLRQKLVSGETLSSTIKNQVPSDPLGHIET